MKRVNARASVFGAKKVRLLTSPDAPDLVSRYTALAETAWIAKLAQTLVGLYFDWPINSQLGERRITVISGGLTARVRRKYHLNSLLNPRPADSKMTEQQWEEDCDKNRRDKRHHALDAMVLSFIPAWARDKTKEKFFSLPEGITRDTFKRALDTIIPRPLALEKRILDATIYGKRVIHVRDKKGKLKSDEYGVKRVPLASLIVDTDIKKIRTLRTSDKWSSDVEVIVDVVIRKEVETFLREHPDLDLSTWDKWCAQYCRGGDGPRVKKVMVTITKPNTLDEFRDLSKDGSSQLFRGKSHKGYFVVRTRADAGKKSQIKVRPVYAHAPKKEVLSKIKQEGLENLGFYQSGCLVRIDRAIDDTKPPLAPGLYQLNTMLADGRARVTNHESKKSEPIGLDKLVEAGLCRAAKHEKMKG